jgi:hypothetical protein
MRRAFVLFALLSCASYRVANAQRALAQSVTLPSGVTVARACTQLTQEGVLVASLDTRPLSATGGQYLAAVAQRIARRVDLPAQDPPRSVVYGALLLHTGAMTQQFPVRQSDDRALDGRVANVLSSMASDGDSLEGALAVPDSLRVMITIGQHDDGSPFVASHTRCPAVAYPDNQAAVLPSRASGVARSVTMRAVVTAAGRVDTASARVDDESDDRLVEAAMVAVSQMRFVPAEFDGAKFPQRIEIVVPFTSSDSAEAPARR